jgi:hypothetical protein
MKDDLSRYLRMAASEEIVITPFPHDERVVRVGYSLFSVVVRILALAYLLAWAFGRLRS